jgi:hypothetical protein
MTQLDSAHRSNSPRVEKLFSPSDFPNENRWSAEAAMKVSGKNN